MTFRVFEREKGKNKPFDLICAMHTVRAVVSLYVSSFDTANKTVCRQLEIRFVSMLPPFSLFQSNRISAAIFSLVRGNNGIFILFVCNTNTKHFECRIWLKLSLRVSLCMCVYIYVSMYDNKEKQWNGCTFGRHTIRNKWVRKGITIVAQIIVFQFQTIVSTA